MRSGRGARSVSRVSLWHFISESLHFSNAHYGFLRRRSGACDDECLARLCFLPHHALAFFKRDENRYLLRIFPPRHSLHACIGISVLGFTTCWYCILFIYLGGERLHFQPSLMRAVSAMSGTQPAFLSSNLCRRNQKTRTLQVSCRIPVFPQALMGNGRME